MVNKTVIYLNPAHTPRSPGGVSGGRTEHGDSIRLCRALLGELKGLPAEIVTDSSGFSAMTENDLLFVFHRGTAEKNSLTRGAEIYVKENASADIQLNAFCLLSRICSDGGFRYRRVHTLTPKSPFISFGRASPERAFLLKTGFIDNAGDNEIFDRELTGLARGLASEIKRIYKERKYEDNC
jgi:hypothetical protein